jgi:hypothetical protein
MRSATNLTNLVEVTLLVALDTPIAKIQVFKFAPPIYSSSRKVTLIFK